MFQVVDLSATVAHATSLPLLVLDEPLDLLQASGSAIMFRLYGFTYLLTCSNKVATSLWASRWWEGMIPACYALVMAPYLGIFRLAVLIYVDVVTIYRWPSWHGLEPHILIEWLYYWECQLLLLSPMPQSPPLNHLLFWHLRWWRGRLRYLILGIPHARRWFLFEYLLWFLGSSKSK